MIESNNKKIVPPRTGHEGPEGQKCYSSTLPLTSALDGVGSQRHISAILPPAKIREPLYRRLGVPQGRPGQVRNISPPPGLDLRTAQAVASSYTDYTIPDRTNKKILWKFKIFPLK
jgi:hypothetical protein